MHVVHFTVRDTYTFPVNTSNDVFTHNKRGVKYVLTGLNLLRVG